MRVGRQSLDERLEERRGEAHTDAPRLPSHWHPTVLHGPTDSRDRLPRLLFHNAGRQSCSSQTGRSSTWRRWPSSQRCRSSSRRPARPSSAATAPTSGSWTTSSAERRTKATEAHCPREGEPLRCLACLAFPPCFAFALPPPSPPRPDRGCLDLAPLLPLSNRGVGGDCSVFGPSLRVYSVLALAAARPRVASSTRCVSVSAQPKAK